MKDISINSMGTFIGKKSIQNGKKYISTSQQELPLEREGREWGRAYRGHLLSVRLYLKKI